MPGYKKFLKAIRSVLHCHKKILKKYKVLADLVIKPPSILSILYHVTMSIFKRFLKYSKGKKQLIKKTPPKKKKKRKNDLDVSMQKGKIRRKIENPNLEVKVLIRYKREVGGKKGKKIKR